MVDAPSNQRRKPHIPRHITVWPRTGRRLRARLAGLRPVQRRTAQRALDGERRRIARDLHDGLAQELTFIANLTRRLQTPDADAATVAHLRSASERALHECRSTLTILRATDEASIDLLMSRTAELFHTRFGAEVQVEVEGGRALDAERRDALLRILHEALTNAVWHGSAERILVRLVRSEPGSSLSIADDGSGFDVDAALATGAGIGLTSMRERAELLGGRCSIQSSPDEGTLVKVVLP
jgi:signal transduction histidine kinase